MVSLLWRANEKYFFSSTTDYFYIDNDIISIMNKIDWFYDFD